MAVPKAEKSDRLKNVEATFGPGSPARMLLEIDVLTLELELENNSSNPIIFSLNFI